MPSAYQMIFDVIARDGASPAFRTVAAEAKALAASMADADARMTAGARASSAEIDASLKTLADAHRATADSVIRGDTLMVDATKASAAEMSAANEGLAASMAASSRAIVEAQRAAMASSVEMGATIDRVAVEETAATEASAARRTKSLKEFGAASALALVGVAYYSVKAATSFEASMARVQTMAGASAKELHNMSNGILDLAPKVGIGPDKLAESLYHIESAGFSGAKALDMVAASAKLSAIGQDDINSSTQAVVATLASNIKGVRDANDAAAQILHTVGTGDMTMHQFTQALGTGLLATAAAVGLSFKDVGAAIATMTDNAIPADQAATKLRTSLLMMVNPSGPASAALASIGMNATALAGDLQKPDGLKVALDDIRVHLDKTFPKDGGIPLTIGAQRAAIASYRQELATAGVQGKELDKAVAKYTESLSHGTTNTVLQEQAFAKMFGGSKNAGTMLVLFNEQLDRMNPKLASYGDANSRAAEMQAAWAKQQSTFKQQLNELGASIDVAKIKIGNALLPVLKEIVGFMSSHTEVVKVLAALIGGVLVTSTVAWGVALMSTGVGEFVMALTVAGIAIYELVTHFKEVTNFLHGPWGTAISAAVAAMMPFIGIPMLIIGHWKEISGFFEHIWHDVSNWAKTGARDVVGAVEAMGRFFTRVWHDIAAVVSSVVDFIGRHWRLLLVIFLGPIGFIIDLIYKFRDQVGGAFAWIARVCLDQMKLFWNVVTSVFKVATGVVFGIVRVFWDITVALFRNSAGFVFGILRTFWDFVYGLFKNSVKAVVDIFLFFWHVITDTAVSIWHDVERPFHSLWDALKAGFNDVVGVIKTAWDKLHDIFGTPIKFLVRYVYNDAIVPVWNGVAGVIGENGLKIKPVDLSGWAEGGGTSGPWRGDDRIIKVGGNEHIWTAEEVDAAGGHDRVAAIRSAIVGKPVRVMGDGPGRGYASGGGLWHDLTHNSVTDAAGSALHALTHNPVTDVLGGAAKAVANLARGALADTAGPILNGAVDVFGHMVPNSDRGWGKASVDMGHGLVNHLMDWIRGQDKKDQASMFGGADPIALLNYARQYVGHVPYLWGGTTPAGWDCSGYTSWVYNHFGLGAPRTSEAQQAWARPSGEVPGALAFFGRPAHHVGLALGGGQMLDAAHTGTITRQEPLWSDLSGFGLPPGGLGAGGAAVSGDIKAMVKQMAIDRGWGDQFGAIDYIVSHESSWNPNAQNSSSTAHGLFQLLYGAGSDARSQAVNGLNYIAQRYGNPDRAQAFWQSHGWYANGGMPPVGQPFTVGERGPETMVQHRNGALEVFSNEQSRKMVGSGPLMHVEQMNVGSNVDMQLELERAAFLRETAGIL